MPTLAAIPRIDTHAFTDSARSCLDELANMNVGVDAQVAPVFYEVIFSDLETAITGSDVMARGIAKLYEIRDEYRMSDNPDELIDVFPLYAAMMRQYIDRVNGDNLNDEAAKREIALEVVSFWFDVPLENIA